MIYKEFQDLKLSGLGMGTMRLPVINNENGKIDEAETQRMVAYAMEHGVNYYDTAWGYHEGQSEVAMGKALRAYPRESYYLADKFPGYDLANMGHVEEIFEEQLKKCGVEYFDFYLITVVLSGMSNFEQMQANIRTYEEEKPLNEAEFNALLKIAGEMVQQIALSCTACRYCTSHCPQQLDIPSLLSLYNEHCFTGGGFFAPMALSALPEDKQPGACIGCGSCEAVCPQQIKISEAMADFVEKLK